MSSENKRVTNCIKGGCYDVHNCSECGFDKAEDARRKEIPLTLCEDGLRRKIIHRKHVEETEGTP